VGLFFHIFTQWFSQGQLLRKWIYSTHALTFKLNGTAGAWGLGRQREKDK